MKLGNFLFIEIEKKIERNRKSAGFVILVEKSVQILPILTIKTVRIGTISTHPNILWIFCDTVFKTGIATDQFLIFSGTVFTEDPR